MGREYALAVAADAAGSTRPLSNNRVADWPDG
jgi:hypothetical protein